MGKGQSFDIFQKNLKSFQSGPRVLLQQGLDVTRGAAGPPGGFEGFIEGFNWRVYAPIHVDNQCGKGCASVPMGSTNLKDACVDIINVHCAVRF